MGLFYRVSCCSHCALGAATRSTLDIQVDMSRLSRAIGFVNATTVSRFYRTHVLYRTMMSSKVTLVIGEPQAAAVPTTAAAKSAVARPAVIARVSRLLGYTFRDATLLRLALEHRALLSARGVVDASSSLQPRLEFIGDSVLELVISTELFALYPRALSGELTTMKSTLVNNGSLASLARRIGLADSVGIPSVSGISSGHLEQTHIGILSDTLEAVFGAVFLDGGLDSARVVILGIYGDLRARLGNSEQATSDGTNSSAPAGKFSNPKGFLQEWLVRSPWSQCTVRYFGRHVSGRPHEPCWEAEAWLVPAAVPKHWHPDSPGECTAGDLGALSGNADDRSARISVGTAKSLQGAERTAAEAALRTLQRFAARSPANRPGAASTTPETESTSVPRGRVEPTPR